MNPSHTPRQQLLLVDDEEDALLELAELLEGEGFTCHTATSVKLASAVRLTLPPSSPENSGLRIFD